MALEEAAELEDASMDDVGLYLGLQIADQAADEHAVSGADASV